MLDYIGTICSILLVSYVTPLLLSVLVRSVIHNRTVHYKSIETVGFSIAVTYLIVKYFL